MGRSDMRKINREKLINWLKKGLEGSKARKKKHGGSKEKLSPIQQQKSARRVESLKPKSKYNPQREGDQSVIKRRPPKKNVQAEQSPVEPKPVWGDEWKEPLPDIEPVTEEHSWWKRLNDKSGDERSFHIGVDSGTSGIRVASFREDHERARLFDFGENLAGGTRFSFPSAAGVKNNRLLLGNDAVELNPRDRFESLKRSIMFRSESEKFNELWTKLKLPFSKEFSGKEGPGAGEFLFTILIARSIELSLPELLSGDFNDLRDFDDVLPLFVMGHPIGKKDEEQEHRFARVLATALVMMGNVGPSPDVEEAAKKFAGAWVKSAKMIEEDTTERLFKLRTEVEATVVALSEYLTNDGVFVLADLGATTVELSVIMRPTSGVLNVWVNKSLPLGVDILDYRFADEEGRVDHIKRRIDRRSRSDGGGQELADTPEFQGFVEVLAKNIKSVMYKAVSLHPYRPDWTNIRVCIAGGGSNIKPLRNVFKNDLISAHPFIENAELMMLRTKETKVVGENAEQIVQEERAELTCVCGLADPVELALKVDPPPPEDRIEQENLFLDFTPPWVV